MVKTEISCKPNGPKEMKLFMILIAWKMAWDRSAGHELLIDCVCIMGFVFLLVAFIAGMALVALEAITLIKVSLLQLQW